MQAAFGNCYPLVCFSYASWSGTFNPPHPKQNCTHWKISSAFPLYFMTFCLTFCLLLYEMYSLTTTFLLFFSSYTFHFSHMESSLFLHLSVWKAREPGADRRAGHVEAKKLLWQSRELGKGIRGRGWREKVSGNRKRSRTSSHHIYSRCSHNIFNYQNSQTLFSTLSAFFPIWQEPFQLFSTSVDGSDLSNLSYHMCFCAARTGMHSVQPHLLADTQGIIKPACGLMQQSQICSKVGKCIIHSRDTYSILLQYLKQYSYLRILCCPYCNQKCQSNKSIWAVLLHEIPIFFDPHLKVYLPFLLHLVSQTMMFPSLPPVQKTAERKEVLLASKSIHLINWMQYNAIYVPLALLSQHLGCQSWKYKIQAIVLPCFLTCSLTLTTLLLSSLQKPAYGKHIHTLGYGSRYPILSLPKSRNVQILASGHHQTPTRQFCLPGWVTAQACAIGTCQFPKLFFSP